MNNPKDRNQGTHRTRQEAFGRKGEGRREGEQAGLEGEDKLRALRQEIHRRYENAVFEEAYKARRELMKMREEAQRKYEEAESIGDWRLKSRARRRLKIIEGVLEFWDEKGMKIDKSKALLLPAIVEALKNNLEDNPKELAKFLLTYSLHTARKALEDIPQPHKLLEEYEENYRLYGMFSPTSITKNIGLLFDIIRSRTFDKKLKEE